MRRKLEAWMREEKGWFLTPLALLWQLIAWLRHQLYLYRWLRTSRIDLPVINVGSIAVGGVGKTPLVMKLLEELAFYKGAVLTRGYLGGDEAKMIAKRYPDVVVKVGKDRVKSALSLTDREFCLLDDGWQYRKLCSDFAIAVLSDDVMDAAYVPKGRLRDLPCRLEEADMVVVTHAIEKEGWKNRLSAFTKAPVVFAEYVVARIVWMGKEIVLETHDPIACFCGIGNPERFFSLLQGRNIQKTLILADHEKPTVKELEQLAQGVKAILCTEKDFVKLGQLALPIGMVEVEYKIVEGEAVFHSLLEKVKTEIHRRR